MHLTHAMLEADYTLLRATPPFRGWHLPAAEEIEFHVYSSTAASADYSRSKNGRPRIRVNDRWVGSLERLTVNMAHEMVHLHLDILDDKTHWKHGARFLRAAAVVARFHHFDLKNFCAC